MGEYRSKHATARSPLGHGGLDLTASLVGAGFSANEIQIWTNDDAVLSCDPSVLHGGYGRRSLDHDVSPRGSAPRSQSAAFSNRGAGRPPGDSDRDSQLSSSRSGRNLDPRELPLPTKGVVRSIARLTNVGAVHLSTPGNRSPAKSL